MKIRPLFDRIVVRPEENKTTINTGLVLPDTAKQKQEKGIVVAVADGTNFDGEKIEMKVIVGDKIFFNKFAGVELKIDGEDFIVMRQIDVIGVIDD